MCTHVNNLINARFYESASAGWDLDNRCPPHVVQAQPSPASENMDTIVSQSSIEESIGDTGSGWEKVVKQSNTPLPKELVDATSSQSLDQLSAAYGS